MNQPASGFVVEKGVPIPPRVCGMPSELKKAVLAMKPSDSIQTDNHKEAHAIWTTIKRAGYVPLQRKLEKGGWRIWRVK